jgi:ParB/RepB/Spo0J family partition protein
MAGERRLRAAQMAGFERIPALVKKATDQEALEVALLENLQREDLPALADGVSAASRGGGTASRQGSLLGSKCVAAAQIVLVVAGGY